MDHYVSLLAALGISRMQRPRGTALDHVGKQQDQHVVARLIALDQLRLRQAAERARAAKRERDRHWIEAAEAKRLRKRGKAAKNHMGCRDAAPARGGM